MHLPTHILSGWCAANSFKFTARERLFCMIAASIADVDGISRIFGEEAYWRFHHVAGHNLFWGLLASIVLATFSTAKVKAFVVYLALFHLHLYMDFWGSGPGWSIDYLWPIGNWSWKNPSPWEFTSWQNAITFVALLAWAVAIVFTHRRTPLEKIAPRLDQKCVETFGLQPQPR